MPYSTFMLTMFDARGFGTGGSASFPQLPPLVSSSGVLRSTPLASTSYRTFCSLLQGPMLNSVESPGRPSPLSAAAEPVAVCVSVTFATLVGVSLMSGDGTLRSGTVAAVTTELGQSLHTEPGLAIATMRSPTWNPPAD